MNNQDLIKKADAVMASQIYKRGYIAPVDVLLDLNVLDRKDYEAWRRGRVKILEKVIHMNLHKLSFLMKEVRAYARKNNLEPRLAVYKNLRFSVSGARDIEKNYSTHYIDKERIRQLKEARNRKIESELISSK